MTLLLRRSGRTRRTRDVTQRRGLVRCWKWWLLLGIVVYAVVGSVVGWIALRWPSTTPTTAGKEKDKNHIHHTPSTILWHAFWDAAPNSHNAADEAPLPKEAPSRTIPSVLDEVEDRRCVWNRLRQAGVSESILQQHQDQLPTWTAVTKQYGDHPVILGLHSCAVYQTRVPPERRMLGAAGMFSTGTNLVTQLLKHNCAIPERLALYGPNATKEQLGMRWQVRE